jgi:prepilin signal peptidase PulO-like enzyme (type II secretory pathway)
MFITPTIFLFILGLIVGSFLNVVILRFNTGRGLGGRSSCMSCATKLAWWELVPLISFCALRGRCKSCRTPLSWQYPLVEAGTGALFALLYVSLQPQTLLDGIHFVLMAMLACIMVVIFVYDLRHTIIPDECSYTAAVIAFAAVFINSSVFTASGFVLPAWHALAAGPIIALPFFLLWLVSRGTWMGLGDAKLMLSLGWMVGLVTGATGTVFAFWLGALVSIAYYAVRNRTWRLRNIEVPFAPFLIVGIYLAFFTGFDVLALAFYLS